MALALPTGLISFTRNLCANRGWVELLSSLLPGPLPADPLQDDRILCVDTGPWGTTAYQTRRGAENESFGTTAVPRDAPRAPRPRAASLPLGDASRLSSFVSLGRSAKTQCLQSLIRGSCVRVPRVGRRPELHAPASGQPCRRGGGDPLSQPRPAGRAQVATHAGGSEPGWSTASAGLVTKRRRLAPESRSPGVTPTGLAGLRQGGGWGAPPRRAATRGELGGGAEPVWSHHGGSAPGGGRRRVPGGVAAPRMGRAQHCARERLGGLQVGAGGARASPLAGEKHFPVRGEGKTRRRVDKRGRQGWSRHIWLLRFVAVSKQAPTRGRDSGQRR